MNGSFRFASPGFWRPTPDGPSPADPARNLDGIAETGGGEESQGSSFAGMTQAPGLGGKTVRLLIPSITQRFDREGQGVLRRPGDLLQHSQIAEAMMT